MNTETPNSGHADHDSCTRVMLYSMLSFHDLCYSPNGQLNSDFVMYILSLDLLIKSSMLMFYSLGLSYVSSYV